MSPTLPRRASRQGIGIALLLLVLAATACTSTTSTSTAPTNGTDTPTVSAATIGPTAAGTDVQRHPDIVDAELEAVGDRVYDVRVTVSSPYDTPQRYADGWRVLAPDGTVLGTHTLAHDHAGEQPFTRTQSGVEIPADIDEVTIEGRDQRYGFGGDTVTVAVP